MDIIETDVAACELIRSTVRELRPFDLARDTPCDGWQVVDLLDHMNHEHALILGDPAG